MSETQAAFIEYVSQLFAPIGILRDHGPGNHSGNHFSQYDVYSFTVHNSRTRGTIYVHDDRLQLMVYRWADWGDDTGADLPTRPEMYEIKIERMVEFADPNSFDRIKEFVEGI